MKIDSAQVADIVLEQAVLDAREEIKLEQAVLDAREEIKAGHVVAARNVLNDALRVADRHLAVA
ncbi:MAG TPA: hypothetical protein VLI04_02020 [Nocardioidaceae bacterium]|nr:hypothetical protein [Nocardioidaceae bacterium]